MEHEKRQQSNALRKEAMANRSTFRSAPVDYHEVGHFVANPENEDRFSAPYYYDVLLHEHAGDDPMYYDKAMQRTF